MARHDEGTPSVIYHVVQQSAWDAAQAADEYFPPRYDKDGFIHATHEAAPLHSKTHLAELAAAELAAAGLPRPKAPVRFAVALGLHRESARSGPAVQPWSLKRLQPCSPAALSGYSP